MKPNNFEIRFSNQANAFYAGQIVNGVVIIETPGAIDINEITMRFTGASQVHWDEERTSSTQQNSVNFTAQTTPLNESPRVDYSNAESYLDKTYTLYGTGQTTQLTAGYHQFDFSFNLPLNIPSSFEGDFGNVRYVASVKVNRKGMFSSDWTREMPFTVISLYDLNLDQQALKSGQGNETHTLGCLCCVRGDISSSITIPKIGYVGGEDIYYTAIINNNSTKGVNRSIVSLVQEITYKAASSQKVSTTVINKYESPSIDPMDTQTVQNVPLRVPPLPPSGLIHCNIIDLKYLLKLEVIPSGFHMSAVCSIELIIGTIPLQSTFNSFQPTPQPVQPGWGPQQPDIQSSLATAPELPAVNYPDMPPPSYAQSMFKPQNVPANVPANLYFPMYPYFNAGDQGHQQMYYPSPAGGPARA